MRRGECVHWIVFVTSLYIYNAPCIVLVEKSVCHEPISVLIIVFTLLAYCLLNSLLIVTLTLRDLDYWSSIAAIAPQRQYGENIPDPF